MNKEDENGPFDAHDPKHRLYTHAQVSALVEAARREEREACAATAERHDDGYHGAMGCEQRAIERAVSDAIAERIRARGDA